MVAEDEAERHGEVAEWAKDLPETFLYCREMGHNWLPYSAGRYKDGGFERTLRCSRCRTRKTQQITSRGLLMGTRYDHPDGYLTHGLGAIVGEERGLLRLESMTRIVAKVKSVEPGQPKAKKRAKRGAK